MRDPEIDIPEFSYHTRRQTPAYDPMMRRMALGAGGVATLVILVALVWSGMKPGLGFGAPPVISAPPGPLRIVPANPGGLTVPEADEQIMSGSSSNAPAQLAPVTPGPDISAFQPPAPASAPASPASAPTLAPLGAAPTVPAGSAPEGSSALAALSAPPPPPVPVVNNDIEVQLAAAIDPAGPKASWRQLNKKMPELFAGHTPIYSHAKVAGVQFWRLRVGGFADIAAARRFCASVKARADACTVAAF